jgi:hypothetical protein
MRILTVQATSQQVNKGWQLGEKQQSDGEVALGFF